tara:strand:- start:1473 stop:1718 length:246 start_codon:yes stop_codon:yes gene_type:complete
MKTQNEKWYNTIDTSKALDYLMDDNTQLRHLIMKNENERVEQDARNRIKTSRLETEVNELKFCVYTLMFLITVVLMAMAFS